MKRFAIFKPGKHTSANGQELSFTEADLQAAVRVYDPAKHEAPLTVGHPKDNLPAYGWVGSLSFDEGQIQVEPKEVEPQFAEMVQTGRFKKRSASFYAPGSASHPLAGTADHDKFYLRHVAFLGAQPPAVKGLKDVEFSEEEGTVDFEEDWIVAGILSRLFSNLRDYLISTAGLEKADQLLPKYSIEDLAQHAKDSRPDPSAVPIYAEGEGVRDAISWLRKAVSLHQRHMEGTAPVSGEAGERSQKTLMEQIKNALAALTEKAAGSMDMSEHEDSEMKPEEIKALQDENAKLKGDNAELTKQVTKLTADFAEVQKKQADADKVALRAGIKSKIEAFVKAGKVTPAEVETLTDFAAAQDDATQSFDFAESADKKVKVTARDLFLRQLEARPVSVDFNELSGREPAAGDPIAAANQKLLDQVSGKAKAA